MTLTVTISGNPVNALHKSVKPHDTIDLRKTLTFVVRDDSGTANYQPGEPVTLVDDVSGYTFKGFVNDAQASNSYPNTLNYITVTCSDNHALADWVSSKKDYENQYSGDIVSDLLSNYLASEGVTAHYAIRRDTTQAQFSQGVLSGTVATNNVVDGDLELAPAGVSVEIVEAMTADFSTGSLFDVTTSNNSLTATADQVIKFTGTMNIPSFTNGVAQYKIWSGSYTVGSSDAIFWTTWIDPSSPEIKATIDVIFSDGSNYLATNVQSDFNFLLPATSTDLAGYADGKWYDRALSFTYSGKTVVAVVAVLGGTKTGTYTAYFKNITIGSQTIFNGTLQMKQQLQIVGYTNLSLSQVPTYNLTLPTIGVSMGTGIDLSSSTIHDRISNAYDISSAVLLRDSFISWNANVPSETLLTIKYRLNGGAIIDCVNNAPLPGLLPGMNLAGCSLQIYEIFFRMPGASPELAPTLNSLELTINPSFNCIKNDLAYYTLFSATETGAVFSNTVQNTNIAAGALSLIGITRNWDDTNDANQTGYFNSPAFEAVIQRSMSMVNVRSGTGEAKDRYDFAGQYQDFIAEIDVQITSDANLNAGPLYRCTNLSTNSGSFAYAVYLSQTGISLVRGTNTTAGGSTTPVASVSLTLSANSWHRVKMVISGTNHKIYLDDVLQINATSTNFNISGYLGVIASTSTSASQGVSFDNFGVMPALTGTWTSPSLSLNALVTYGNSYIRWRDRSEAVNADDTVSVQVSTDAGSTWTSCTNGAPLPIFTSGQSLSGVTLLLRVVLSTTTATRMPAIDIPYLIITGGYSSSGTRLSPALSLTSVAGAVGSTLVSWDAILSPGTALFIDTTLDNGLTFTNVGSGASGSAPIPGIITQPDPIIDEFDTGSTRYVPRIFGGTLILTVANPNYTTYSLGVGSAAITYDTAHSRITAIGASGNNTLFRSDLVSSADMSIQADFDEANTSGLAVRITSTNSCYVAYISDSVAGNMFALYSVVNGTVFTQIATGTLDFTRGTPHRFILSAIGTTIMLSMDGATLTSVTNNTVTGAGKAGLLLNQLLRCYGLRIQGLGASVVGTTVSTRARLISADPGATPQLTDLTVSVHNPNIANGTLIPLAQYSILSGSTNTLAQDFDDQAKQSNYIWDIDTNFDFFFGPRHAKPAPWILSDSDVLIASCQLHTINDLYRNDQFGTGGKDIIPFTKSFVGDGSTTNWTMDYPVDSLTSVAINNVAATVGVKNVDTGRDFYYEQGSLVIIQSSTALPRVKTQTLVFSYNAQVNTAVEMRSDTQIALRAAIDRTNGIIEATEDMTGLSKTAMIQLAQSRLDQYAVVGQTLTCTTMRSGLAAGMLLPVFLSRFNIIDGQFLITDMSPTWSISRGTLQPYYALTLTSGPVIGDYTRFLSNIAKGGL